MQLPDCEGAEFAGLSMASATFREVDLSGARMRGVLLLNADIDGAIHGLRVNGVEVMPLIEAELDRLHPERLRLRPATPETMRDAVDVIEELWQATALLQGVAAEFGEDLADLAEQVVAVRSGEGAQVLAVPAPSAVVAVGGP